MVPCPHEVSSLAGEATPLVACDAEHVDAAEHASRDNAFHGSVGQRFSARLGLSGPNRLASNTPPTTCPTSGFGSMDPCIDLDNYVPIVSKSNLSDIESGNLSEAEHDEDTRRQSNTTNPTSNDIEKEQRQERQAETAHLLVTVGIFVTAVAMTIPARPELLLSAVGGSMATASLVSGSLDSMSSSVEIFANPVLGNVSDGIGRKPVLIVAQMGEFFALLIMAQLHSHVWAFYVAYMRKYPSSNISRQTQNDLVSCESLG